MNLEVFTLPNISQRRTISADQAAKLLGLSKVTVLSEYHAGRIAGYRKTGTLRSPVMLYLDSVYAYAKTIQGRDLSRK